MSKQVNKVLVIDDEKNITYVVKAILEKQGFEVVAENNSLNGLALLEKPDHGFNCLVTDLFMPNVDGIEILDKIKSTQPNFPIIMITAYGTVDRAVQALKKGAFDFITKPFEQGELVKSVEKAVQSFRISKKEPMFENQENFLLQSILIGKSTKMIELNKLISKYASADFPVLITAEAGNGRDIIASEIYRMSKRVNDPFIKVIVSASPSEVIENEIFGIEEDTSSKPSKLELANNGTLYIDEISKLSKKLQIKLYNVISERSYEKLNGNKNYPIDVRFIFGTSKNLKNEMTENNFSEELFYEINSRNLIIPNLKDRKEDIEDLLYYFIQKSNQKLNKAISNIEPNCLIKLKNYQWPGNLKEFESEIERAVLVCETNCLIEKDFSDEILSAANVLNQTKPREIESKSLRGEDVGKEFKDIVKQHTLNVERQIIEKALEQTSGNITKTADRLGLSRKGLQLKLKELGLSSGRTAKDSD